ncbi:MAG: hypothetical protein R3F50_08060 [Gammaproteobacteria bacterium]
MATAEELFSNTFGSVTTRFTGILSLRKIAGLGILAVTPALYEEWMGFAVDLFHGPESDKFFHDKDAGLKVLGGVDNLGQQLVENEIRTFTAAIDAASLVFAHSIVDGAVLDYLRVTYAHSKESWLPFVANKNIKISDMTQKDNDTLIAEKIEALLDELDRQPLLVKSDRLFQICKPEADFNPIVNFRFDKDRLEQLGELRHKVVHGSGVVGTLPNGDDDISFLWSTANYYMSLVNMRFDTKIDPRAAFAKGAAG